MSAQPTPPFRTTPDLKPASLPISVTPVADQPLLCVKVGPLLTYVNLDEAVAMRAMLDAEIARLSERFL
jgi:hypothetical protein